MADRGLPNPKLAGGDQPRSAGIRAVVCGRNTAIKMANRQPTPPARVVPVLSDQVLRNHGQLNAFHADLAAEQRAKRIATTESGNRWKPAEPILLEACTSSTFSPHAPKRRPELQSDRLKVWKQGNQANFTNVPSTLQANPVKWKKTKLANKYQVYDTAGFKPSFSSPPTAPTIEIDACDTTEVGSTSEVRRPHRAKRILLRLAHGDQAR